MAELELMERRASSTAKTSTGGTPWSGTRRLGVLLTHPVQYYSPLFAWLARQPGLDLTVHYAHRPSAEEQGEGFGVSFTWDIDLLGGYRHEWLVNRAARPSMTAFAGCDTPEIAGVIQRERYDAFLVMGWHARSYWQAMRACWRTGTPVLVRGDSQLAPEAPRLRRAVKRAAYPLFVRRFAACLSVGTRSAEYFAHYGARRVVPSPHFIDNARFAAAADAARRSRQALRAAWGIDPGAFVALFAGKLVAKKRPLDVIRAVGGLSAPRPTLLVVGEGELRAECERAARDAGVDARFAGFLNQQRMPDAYAAADVLVLPSDGRETWGLVVNEAMASGIPAIVSRAAGCAPDLIVEGETGHAFPPGDVDALRAALAAVAADREAAARMGRRAREHVARFSVDAAGQGVLDAVAVAAGERGA